VSIEHRSSVSPRSTTLLAVVVVTAVFYFARVVFIPLALAILFTFLLAPLVIRLRRWNFGRVPSVLTVVTLAFVILLLVSGLMSIQLNDLAQRLPEYQDNIRAKLHSIRESSSGLISRFTSTVHEFSEELTPTVPPKSTPGEVKPVPVEIRRNAFSPMEAVGGLVGSVIHLFFTASIVVVFVIFMLFQREDLRDRLIRLIGAGQINLTTKALDDAAHRVSRYLLAQLALNVGFGVLAGLGLFFMGVPNPVLWAVLAILLRYVPYLGIWLAAAMPAAISFATNPGWMEPIGIFVLYFGIDLLVLNFVEPMLYGGSTGISPMAILAAAIFWTWLWGPIGLLLSTPLTVCLVVIGCYVPSLEFLSILLGDQPVLTPDKRLYQRLLAGDLEEGTEIAEEHLKAHKSLEKLYDEVVIPALILAEEDRHRGRLDEKRERFIFESTRVLVEDIAERADDFNGPPDLDKPEAEAIASPQPLEVCVLCMPARDEADELSAFMLAQLLNRKGVGTKAVPASLASERLEEAAASHIQIVCISAIPPSGHAHARYLAKRLRAQYPAVKIIFAFLNEGDVQELRQRQSPVPADEVVTTLQQALSVIIGLSTCAKEPAEQKALTS
jgi:predicted PurR-regulated permease PerM